MRINAAVRAIDPSLTYSRLIDGLTKAGVGVDRKVMAELAVHEPAAFKRPGGEGPGGARLALIIGPFLR